MAALATLEGERALLARRREALASSATHVETAAAAATAAARLEVDAATAAATTRLSIAVATATAMKLGSASSIATVPAVTAAGLCTRRGRNRQGGDTRGQE
jgi:hypothetical protein